MPKSPIGLNASSVLGDLSAASVGIVEYSDFDCPFCRQFARTTLHELIERYVTKKLVVIDFRHFPLTQIHPSAMMAAQIATCAGRQGQFWNAHDFLFSGESDVDERSDQFLLRQPSLNAKTFEACIATEARKIVDQDIASGRDLAVRGTPTFFIGRLKDGKVLVKQRLSGNQPAKDFIEVIDALLR